MVVKNQIKFIKSLQQKKYRNLNGLFVAEGVKLVKELIASEIPARHIYATDEFIRENPEVDAQMVSETVLKRISSLRTPNKVLGVFEIPEPQPMDFSDWVLALDNIQDPGNLGTIIRLCDWFGIKNLLCSPDTVDCYNPKTLQATMGSIARVNVVYDSIEKVCGKHKLPLLGATIQGESIYEYVFPASGILLMGNESKGISDSLMELLDDEISIPAFENSKAESLNVATATAVLLAELRRSATRR